jgi:uncharacterized protein (TIGR03437 family)
MLLPWKVAFATALCGLCTPIAEAQAPTGSIVTFEMENSTFYNYDCPFADVGTNPNKLDHPLKVVGIYSGLGIGDIVSVNGNPAKGAAYELFSAAFVGSPNPAPGHPIVDGARAAIAPWDLDFLSADGTQIGTIHIDGFVGGNRPPDAPQVISGSNWIVTAGSGAFFGVRGYLQISNTTPERVTSACEDPSLRRVFAGDLGKRHGTLYLVPLSQPQIVTTPNGPAIVHANDFSLVTASKPAAAGEILSVFATGLGPTRPGVDPGQPFPASPLQDVNSPVEVTVNGKSAEVLAAVGYPGAVGGYQVNFRVPSDASKGNATIQLKAAWIAGPSVNVPIQ